MFKPANEQSAFHNGNLGLYKNERDTCVHKLSYENLNTVQWNVPNFFIIDKKKGKQNDHFYSYPGKKFADIKYWRQNTGGLQSVRWSIQALWRIIWNN